jgi:hypothetical protein
MSTFLSALAIPVRAAGLSARLTGLVPIALAAGVEDEGRAAG